MIMTIIFSQKHVGRMVSLIDTYFIRDKMIFDVCA